MQTPKPTEIAAYRKECGLTQTNAAALIGKSLGAWQKWEAPESSAQHRRMDPAYWELFQIKAQRVELMRQISAWVDRTGAIGKDGRWFAELEAIVTGAPARAAL